MVAESNFQLPSYFRVTKQNPTYNNKKRCRNILQRFLLLENNSYSSISFSISANLSSIPRP